MTQITFYFDVGSPFAYLAAERLHTLLPEPVAWQPVLLGGLFKLTGRSSWALGDYERRQRGMAEIERRAQQYDLPPMRWPDPWPGDYLTAMRAVTYAFSIDRGREFTMRAFRDAFQRGRNLSQTTNVISAGEAVGISRDALERAIADAEIKARLREATDRAHSLGVFGVPTFAIDDELFGGDDRLEDAARCLS